MLVADGCAIRVLPFAEDHLYLAGLDLAAETPEELASMNGFYDSVHLGEVVTANPGFMSGVRLQLVGPDGRGDLGPEFLTAYAVRGSGFAEAYVERAKGPVGGRPVYSVDPPLWPARLSTRWRLMYQRIMESGPALEDVHAVHIVGMDPPADATEAELAEFDDFYSSTHLVEVMDYFGFTRATRWSLDASIEHPEPGGPRFLGVYEAGSELARRFIEEREPVGLVRIPAGEVSPFSPGPRVWRDRTTSWRLRYATTAELARLQRDGQEVGIR